MLKIDLEVVLSAECGKMTSSRRPWTLAKTSRDKPWIIEAKIFLNEESLKN
jgi:hypothetical protein